MTLVEPGVYGTDRSGPSAVWAQGQPQYNPARKAMTAAAAGSTRSNPAHVGAAILVLADSDEPP
ncbi:hypothetical protein [Streptomyces sp. NPDC051286]|uniref:hypothetical protein n=1 Tax=Streptomyces sp. NPDC051286 TaxID=3365647 RepID=UPI003790308C